MPILVLNESLVANSDENIAKSLLKDSTWQMPAISSMQNISSLNTTSVENTNNNSTSNNPLIILQGECAMVDGTNFNSIASVFATTCNIIFLTYNNSQKTDITAINVNSNNVNNTENENKNDSNSNIINNKNISKVICAHLDESVTALQIQQLLQCFTNNELESDFIDLYLVGGYCDEKCTSLKVSNKILNYFMRIKTDIHLRLLFTQKLNTVMINDKNGRYPAPKYQNIGYNIENGQIFVGFEIQSVFECIPYLNVRDAHMFSIEEHSMLPLMYNCSIADHTENGPRIEPFSWKCPRWVINVVSKHYSDEEILQYFSTSPKVEHREFSECARKLFQFIATQDCNSVFINNKPLYFFNYIENKSKNN